MSRVQQIAAAVVAASVLMPAVYWNATWIAYRHRDPAAVAADDEFVPTRARISPSYPTGPPIEEGASLLMAPPLGHHAKHELQ
jgi:hypothetical protein